MEINILDIFSVLFVLEISGFIEAGSFVEMLISTSDEAGFHHPPTSHLPKLPITSEALLYHCIGVNIRCRYNLIVCNEIDES